MGANVRKKKEIFKGPVSFMGPVDFLGSLAGLDLSNLIIALGVAAVAAAGSGQSTFAQLSKELNAVTGADNTKGVALPAAAAGKAVYILNTDATHALPVAPINGGDDQINGLTAGTGVFTLAPGKGAWFTPTSATQWYVAADAALQATPGSITFSVAAGATNVCVISGQVKDASGAALAGVREIEVYMSTSATGENVSATSYSTGAAVTTGTQIVALSANKVWRLLTDNTGAFAISITASGKPATERVVAILPTTGVPQISAVSGTAFG